MKKFSKEFNYKVGEEPKPIEQKISESDSLKERIQFLMDQFLSIRTYGPIDRYQRAGLIKINGKEMFLEALMGLIDVDTMKVKKLTLEGLKTETRDWELIDNSISKLGDTQYNIEEQVSLIKQKESIVKFYEQYEDSELMLLVLTERVSKINDFSLIEQKYKAAVLLKELNQNFSKIADIYESRYLELKQI
jgi:hypothetical protein